MNDAYMFYEKIKLGRVDKMHEALKKACEFSREAYSYHFEDGSAVWIDSMNSSWVTSETENGR